MLFQNCMIFFLHWRESRGSKTTLDIIYLWTKKIYIFQSIFWMNWSTDPSPVPELIDDDVFLWFFFPEEWNALGRTNINVWFCD